MAGAPRISVLELQDRVQSGRPLLLVCAYANEKKFHKHRLEKAVSLSDFEARLPSLAKDVEIVFY